MDRFFKASVLSAAVAATMLSALPAAEARDWRRHGYHGQNYHHHHKRSNGDAVAAGVIGLAAGALLGSALASQPRYYEPEPTYVIREPRPARTYYRDNYYRATYEPWSPEWYRYCSDRYRSFDARTGTFLGYDGQRHFCQAN
ncbi:BA14K family protein [Aquamicrobium defluvii]|uniref:Lectin-like protein BA14k n=1 Tax=Aquamicrobium defluvii TaxID=69279 RepID=A0A011V7G6_9HYPH|nr:BA14K family protein [Aquamicrobium defluvii]EXL04390.1 hypothetical protein BG36_09690 [Aquamicrobium defluvii]EZQ14194.1 hypothetical protein CF98_21620 [Halopseudomonas bauzanensis]TDR34399.1 BA14K-like protein [Aquamicrobium defluvii]